MYDMMSAEMFFSCLFFIVALIIMNYWLINMFVAVSKYCLFRHIWKGLTMSPQSLIRSIQSSETPSTALFLPMPQDTFKTHMRTGLTCLGGAPGSAPSFGRASCFGCSSSLLTQLYKPLASITCLHSTPTLSRLLPWFSPSSLILRLSCACFRTFPIGRRSSLPQETGWTSFWRS